MRCEYCGKNRLYIGQVLDVKDNVVKTICYACRSAILDKNSNKIKLTMWG